MLVYGYTATGEHSPTNESGDTCCNTLAEGRKLAREWLTEDATIAYCTILDDNGRELETVN